MRSGNELACTICARHQSEHDENLGQALHHRIARACLCPNRAHTFKRNGLASTFPQPRTRPRRNLGGLEWANAEFVPTGRQGENMQFFSPKASGLKLVTDAMVGAYGLTFITIGGSALLVYVLQQLHLIQPRRPLA